MEWGKGPCHYGKQHEFAQGRDMDTDEPVLECRECGHRAIDVKHAARRHSER